MLCVVDDAQWLDQATVDTLGFVARRLAAEPVALVLVARTSFGAPSWTGLPELTVHGLNETDAQALLTTAIVTPLDERVRARVLAETNGNPLALLELPRWLTPTELMLGPVPTSTTLISRLEQGFLRQLEPLPEQTRRLLLVAAAEPLGSAELLWRAVVAWRSARQPPPPPRLPGSSRFATRSASGTRCCDP